MSPQSFLVSGNAMSPAASSQAPTPSGTVEGKPAIPVKTVLIVEDNPFNLKLFDDLLRSTGYNTLKAADGVQALDLARRHRPDVILLDIGLPDISGIEVTRAIRGSEELKCIPVIAVTAYASPEDEAVIRRSGCDDYLAKPIAASDLLRLVRRHASFRVLDGGQKGKGSEIDRRRP
jgi:two-component system, cell cycle response regulator DivK